MCEWSNHPNAEFLEIDLYSGKMLFLTKAQMLETWNITEEEINNMPNALSGSLPSSDFIVKKSGKYILIKK